MSGSLNASFGKELGKKANGYGRGDGGRDQETKEIRCNVRNRRRGKIRYVGPRRIAVA